MITYLALGFLALLIIGAWAAVRFQDYNAPAYENVVVVIEPLGEPADPQIDAEKVRSVADERLSRVFR